MPPWEVYAVRLCLVKLALFRPQRKENIFEFLVETETVIPRQIGINCFVLGESIPVQIHDRFALIESEEQGILFKNGAIGRPGGRSSPSIEIADLLKRCIYRLN